VFRYARVELLARGEGADGGRRGDGRELLQSICSDGQELLQSMPGLSKAAPIDVWSGAELRFLEGAVFPETGGREEGGRRRARRKGGAS
jgi:hypothetical protein